MLPESWWKQSCLWKQWHSYWEEWFHMRECVLTLFKWFQTRSSPYQLYAGAQAASMHVYTHKYRHMHTSTPSTLHWYINNHTKYLNILAGGTPLICSNHEVLLQHHLSVMCYGIIHLRPKESCFFKCKPSCSATSMFESYSKKCKFIQWKRQWINVTQKC